MIPSGQSHTWDLLMKDIHLKVGCRLCGGTYLDKECPLNEDVKGVEGKVSMKENEGSSRVLPCQLPPKELNPWSFTLPCTIGSLNVYALANLVGIADMSKKAHVGIEDRILFDMNGNVHHPTIPIEKVYMANSIQEEESFNPLEIGERTIPQ
ncbi:hypothetical protein Tco_0612908 [Tanacetum coccineum]